MIEILMHAIVWLFYLTVFVIAISLLVEVSMPGKFKTLHEIYRVIFDFNDDKEL